MRASFLRIPERLISSMFVCLLTLALGGCGTNVPSGSGGGANENDNVAPQPNPGTDQPIDVVDVDGVGYASSWGSSSFGATSIPSPHEDFTAIATGGMHSIALKTDGTVALWGCRESRLDYGQCDMPSPSRPFIAVDCGFTHSLGLGTDGRIVAWGSSLVRQCDVPAPNVDFVAISAGDLHSLGLKENGSIVAWGGNTGGQCEVPEPNADFVALAGGFVHSLGLKNDGSIVAWGCGGIENDAGQCDVPEPNTGFVHIAAGSYHSLGIKTDGSIVAWGCEGFDRDDGQCDVPDRNTDFVAVAAGYMHSLGLNSDGSIVAWGSNVEGQCDVPEPNDGFFAFAAGPVYSLALRAGDGDGATRAGLCVNTCHSAGDGECDDGGPGSDYSACELGTDCVDCGDRQGATQGDDSNTEPGDGEGEGNVCTNSCLFAHDGECDDGSPGSEYSICELGTDCADCGSRDESDLDDEAPSPEEDGPVIVGCNSVRYEGYLFTNIGCEPGIASFDFVTTQGGHTASFHVECSFAGCVSGVW